MEIEPEGNLRIIYAGPMRIAPNAVGGAGRLGAASIVRAARELEKLGRWTLRPAERDAAALSVFNVAGTQESLFPLEPLFTAELPLPAFQKAIEPIGQSFLADISPLGSFVVEEVVLRVFSNGYAAVSATVEFGRSASASSIKFSTFVGDAFAFDKPNSIALRESVLTALNEALFPLCSELGGRRRNDDRAARVQFLSTFYSMTASWADHEGKNLPLPRSLRSVVQPEAGELLVNQSNSDNEIVVFTSGFHVHLHNLQSGKRQEQRVVALVSFLNVMNILFFRLEDVKAYVVRLLAKGKTPLFVRTDIDEQLEILFSQVMVSSAVWRRDFSSFRDEIDRRWKLTEHKNYCITLIEALEARAVRKRAIALGVLLALVSAAQVISITNDAMQIMERYLGHPR